MGREPGKAHKNQTFGPGDFLAHLLHLGLREGGRLFDYEDRIKAARWLGRTVLGRVPVMRNRIDANLELIFPERDAAWRATIRAACCANILQSIAEHSHMHAFAERFGHLNIRGEGVGYLDAETGAVIVSGHFGQWEGIRIAWRHLTGQDCAFFFRPHNNGYLDRSWQAYLRQAGEPILPKGRAGKEAMGHHLGSRGAMLMLIDQRIRGAPRLDFMGRPARTALTAAALAKAHNLPLIPAYAVRRDNLVDYDVVFEAPIDARDPLTMTEALNASLGAQVAAHPEQYLWSHRRWR